MSARHAWCVRDAHGFLAGDGVDWSCAGSARCPRDVPTASAQGSLHHTSVPPKHPLQNGRGEPAPTHCHLPPLALPSNARILTLGFSLRAVVAQVCLDILKTAWTPAWTLESVCRAILALLSTAQADRCHSDSPAPRIADVRSAPSSLLSQARARMSVCPVRSSLRARTSA